MDNVVKICMVAVLVLTGPARARESQVGTQNASSVEASESAVVEGPADRILATLIDPLLRSLIVESLERNPRIARARAEARAAESLGPQVRALPDPMVGVTAWLKSPETRTGPQVLTLNWTQGLPWLGRFDLEEQKAIVEATALHHKAEAARLEVLTEVRRLYYELGFLLKRREITLDFLDHLIQHQEISQSRYATGTGASQDVIKIQAEITLAENLLLELDQLRIDLESKINQLRDRPASSVILPVVLPPAREAVIDVGLAREVASGTRPEVIAIDAQIAASRLRSRLAEKKYKPDFSVGLTYTFVDRRDDTAGIVLPPAGNGTDIVGVQGAMTVPIWRKKLNMGVKQAAELEISTVEAKREVLAEIDTEVTNLLQRLPLTWQQLRLLEDILIVQAGEAVQSAQSGYVAGNFNALDLLDAEHVLFDAETAISRALADYLIRLAALEGEIAAPLQDVLKKELTQS